MRGSDWGERLIRVASVALPRRHREAFVGDLVELWEEWRREPGGGRRLLKEALGGAASGWVRGMRYRNDRQVVESWNREVRMGADATRWGSRMVTDVWMDLKVALRRMRKAPAFTFLAVLSLALGVGANTAVFSIVEEVMLKPPPFSEPEGLVNVRMIEPGDAFGTFSYLTFRELQEATSDVFSGAAGVMFNMVGRSDDGGAGENLINELVAGPYFSMLGVGAQIGRVFEDSEGIEPGADPVVVLSDRYWRRAFGADPSVVGRTLQLNGHPYTVIGVADPLYKGKMPGLATDVWALATMSGQLSLSGPGALADRGQESLLVTARLAPGITLPQAVTALEAFRADLVAQFPDRYTGQEMRATPLLDSHLHPALDGVLVPMAALIMAVLGIVLLIACVNLAGFLLARAEGMRREVAVRLALGARRGRLVRGMLTEAGALSLIAGLVGVLFSVVLVDLIVSIELPLPVPIAVEPELNGRVLFFGLAVTCLAGLILGVVPALQGQGGNVAGTLRDETVGGGRGTRLRDILVVGQVAASVVLLVGAGLFLRSLVASQSIDPGFGSNPAAVLALEIPPDRTPEERALFFTDVQERAREVPGVREVGLISRLHLDATGTSSTNISVAGIDPPPGRTTHSVDIAVIDGDAFSVLGIPLVAGRFFHEGDDQNSEAVAVVSEAMAERFWPGADPVGRTYTSNGTEIRVVGVARDTKVHRLGEGATPIIYRPAGQRRPWGRLVASTAGNPAAVLPDLARAARAADPGAIVISQVTIEDHLAFLLVPARLSTLFLVIVGGLAAVLAAIGLYGILAYSVAARKREIGIRMSVGAEPGRLAAMVLGEGMRRVGLGIGVGLVLALAASQLIRGSLYGVGPMDPLTLAVVPVLLALVAAAAAYLPARRASRIDPTQALRSD